MKNGKIVSGKMLNDDHLATKLQLSPFCGHPRGLDAAGIVQALEEAGATLMALPSGGYSTRMSQMRFDVVHTALDAYGWEAPALRAPAPGAAEISAMDRAYAWLRLIPDRSFVIRRILAARSLVHPLTGRHLYTWRRLGITLGADHKSVQRWHASGISMLLEALGQD